MARHIKHHQAPLGTAAHLHDKFHAIIPLANTRRWRTRYELLNDTIAHLRHQGTEPWVIEASFGERAHALTDPTNPRHIRVRTPHELWHKENLINLAAARLPHDWEYMAWIDGDVQFARPDIVNETVQMLQHHPVVQMFSLAQDLGPNFVPYQTHESFAQSYKIGRDQASIQRGSVGTSSGPGHNIWHSGFAWAIRREAFDAVGGLIDWAILGSGDKHMATCLIGRGEKSMHQDISPGYRRHVMRWQEHAEKYIRRNIGVVDGLLVHGHHGPKTQRKYWDRWTILVENQFDPDHDLKRDWQGVWQLRDDGTARHRALRDAMMGYHSSRNEDDPCVE